MARKKPADVRETAAELVTQTTRALAESDGIFRASRDQYLVRARLHMELRDNPAVSVTELTAEQLAGICRDKRVLGWLKKSPEFREWLRAPRDTEERVEAAYAQFVEGLEFRRAGMSDKDYINCVKLLAELAAKMPTKWENTKVLDEGVGRMSDAEKVKTLVDTLQRLGYAVSKPGEKLLDGVGAKGHTAGTGARPDAAFSSTGQPGPGSPVQPDENEI